MRRVMPVSYTHLDVYKRQIHFGANYETGTYGWTTNLDTVKK